MSLFEPRYSKEGTLSGILPATAYKRGTFLMISAVDADTGEITFDLATNKLAGMLTRDSRVAVNGTVRTDEELLFPESSLETPFEVSKSGTVDTGIEIFEVEGSDFIQVGGTGPVLIGTAAGTELALNAGKLRIAQTGDTVLFQLVKQMTREDSTNNACRLLVKAIAGYVKA
jgi:hypothetical protein